MQLIVFFTCLHPDRRIRASRICSMQTVRSADFLNLWSSLREPLQPSISYCENGHSIHAHAQVPKTIPRKACPFPNQMLDKRAGRATYIVHVIWCRTNQSQLVWYFIKREPYFIKREPGKHDRLSVYVFSVRLPLDLKRIFEARLNWQLKMFTHVLISSSDLALPSRTVS